MREWNPNVPYNPKNPISGPNCISFHDVDLIPESEKNFYACIPNTAIHQCDKYNKYNYETQLPSGYFTAGGASMIHKTQYDYINGHANWFWGWGYEDHDMARRLRENSPVTYDKTDFENLDFYEKTIGGLSKKGGHDGFYRQDSFGYYMQLEHSHGFTNGPSGEKLHIAPNSLFLAKEMLGLMRDDRLGATNLNNGTHFVRVETKDGWDGVDKTTYSIIEKSAHKFYTRYRTDIRLSIPQKVDISINKNLELTFNPEQANEELHFKGAVELCNFVHFDYGFCDIEHIINEPEKEKSLLYHSYLRRWTDGMKRCNDQVNIFHGQCNVFTLKWQKQPLLAPHPLKSSNSSDCDPSKRNQVWLRSCPQLGWFQIIPRNIKVNNLPKTVEIGISSKMIMKVFPPIGGLLYLQKTTYEGKHLEEKYVDLGTTMQPLKNQPATGFYEGTTLDEELTAKLLLLNEDQFNFPNKIGYKSGKNGINAELTSKFKLKNALPGFYLTSVRLIDRVGQVYFDMNFVYRVISNKGWDHDHDLRIKFDKSFHRQNHTDEALPMAKNEIYGDFKEKIKAHFQFLK